MAERAQRALARRSDLLDCDDRADIDRASHPLLRARAIAGRVFLRLALTDAVGGDVSPSAWRFERTPDGKPFVPRDIAQIEFSVSHTEGMSVVAVSRSCRVGIDIETEARPVEAEAAASFLTHRELRFVNHLPKASRQSAIIRLWTLKEAYAKLLGIGLAADFKTLGFDLDPIELTGGWEAADAGCGTRFESWSTNGAGGPCYVALAIGQPQAGAGPRQIVGLRLATERLSASGEPPPRSECPGDEKVRVPDAHVVCGVRTGPPRGGAHVPARLF